MKNKEGQTRNPQSATRNPQPAIRYSLFAIRYSRLFLLAILLLAAGLRFTGLNWDEGQWIHPDEGHMRMTLSRIRWPDDLSLYFDTARSPLNVRNSGGIYSYGTLPLFLTRAAGEWLNGACGMPLGGEDEHGGLAPKIVASLLMGPSADGCPPGTFTGAYGALVGRALSALSDLGTVLLVYLIGRRLYGERVGLLSAGLLALTAFSIQQAHFFTVDSMACFFTTLVAYFSVRAAQSGHWADFALAGFATGLAAGCKVSAAFAAFLVPLAAVARERVSESASRRESESARERESERASPRVGERPHRSIADSLTRFIADSLIRFIAPLLLAAILSLVVFRIAQPYAFEGPGFFGLRPSSEWFGRLGQIRAEQSGEIDLPSGRQWTNRTPIIFPWVNMVVWGMGLPLGLAAWIGWALVGVELFRGRREHLPLWGWATVIFLYHATGWVMAMRYFLSLYPIFVIFAAYLLIRLTRLVQSQRLNQSAIRYSPFAIVVIGTLFWALAFTSIYWRPNTRVAASRWIYEHVPEGSTVANEHWDWGLPLRIDGHDPFGGMYTGIEMELYNEDTSQKRAQLYDWLDQADYIFLASNRLYASIPRLPARYPLTTEYYRALFAGELGFELEADFTSAPALGPFLFPDQENPFPLMAPDYEHQRRPVEVDLPPAEESFSVYDHPRVLIFRKTADYSQARAARVLGAVDLERVQLGMTPRQATEAPDLLRFDPQTWAEQRAGGTWSEMFNRDGLLNRHPGLAAVAWWLVVTVLGWLVFPLLFVALPGLRERGYGFAKVLALLLIAYLTWLAASLHALPNTRGTILRMTALLALVGGGIGWLKWGELRRFLRERWRLILLMEALFALLYAAWIGVRLLNPDLWHPVVGGEKPMDFAYLNAVMKSTWFPPYNPWLSGTWINYYYFGFVIVGTLIKLMSTVPAIAYNLAVPLLFALTGSGAFSVAYNLASGEKPGFSEKPGFLKKGVLAGLLAVLFTVLIGNLGVVHLIRGELIDLGGELIPSTIPGFPETVALFKGLWKVIFQGDSFSLRPETWYWHPTRIIPTDPGEVGPITEFPAFTFLYADLHAHMIAFPLTLLALALAVYWARAERPHWGSLALGGLVIGALRPTNTWDYPTYLLLGLIALGLGVWRRSKHGDGETERRFTFYVSRFAFRLASLIGLTLLLYLPYIQNYVAGYQSFELWNGSRTPLGIYLWIYAIFLFPVVSWQVWKLASLQVGKWLVVGGGLLMGVALAILGYPVALVTVPVGVVAALLIILPGQPRATRRRANFRLGVDPTDSSQPQDPPSSILWLMVGTAMVLSLAVEVIVLKGDISRMNTVFKFHLQVWILMAIAAAVCLANISDKASQRVSESANQRCSDAASQRVSESASQRCSDAAMQRCSEEASQRVSDAATRSIVHSLNRSIADSLYRSIALSLILGGALFLPFGIRARAIDRIALETGMTLDGMAFMEHAVIHDGDPARGSREIALRGDYHAIRWMQENVEGSPVIMEGLGHREYLWANRVSIYTGLPAVVGWSWHQRQQRAGLHGQMVEWRRADVRECYNTTDVERARELLERYNVYYIYVGEYERAYYDPAGLGKFDAMVDQGLLELAYDAHGVRIYTSASSNGSS